MRKIRLRYATRSSFKRAEILEIISSQLLKDRHGADVRASDHFEVEFLDVATDEPLKCDLQEMVRHKSVSAYRGILEPCIVEHAGLVTESHQSESYPGGLTQPMFDALGAAGFLSSVYWAGDRAIARAVVGYCDGLSVHLFSGETWGRLSHPAGDRAFYWDTIFVPDEGGGSTYAEIAALEGGIAKKVAISQSKKAMVKCMEFMLRQDPEMFPRI